MRDEVRDEDVDNARGALAADMDAAWHGFRRWAKRASQDNTTGAEWWIQEGRRIAGRLDARFWNQSRGAWRKWAMEACEAGAKLAHRWTKPSVGYKLASEALTPQGAADATLADWRKI